MNQRARAAMPPDEAWAFLCSTRTLVLATIGPEGVPDPVPMWFVVREGDVWMRTYAASQKVANLRRDPRVAVLVEDGDRYAALRGVQVTGRIELSDDIELITDIAMGLMMRYEGLEERHVAAAREAYRPTAAKQAALRLVVDRIVSWDHSRLLGDR